MELGQRILDYLAFYGKENRYRLATALKINEERVVNALNYLQVQGKIEIKEGKAMLVKGVNPVMPEKKIKPEKPKVKKQKVVENAEPKEVDKEKEEYPEETPEPSEGIDIERVEGTVKFFKQNKGFGFIAGDDGNEYYVHESRLNEGVTIEANDRVSFKVVQGDKGLKAKEVEKVGE